MIIKMNLDGVIEKTYGSRVFKGSNGVTEIALFAPFDPQSTVIINFTLPDGTEIPGIMTFADFNVEDHYNMWVYKLRQNVTSMEGRVTLSFEIRAYVDETEVTTTAETHIYIEKSSSTTFLDEVDEFLALANEALARSQQALNLNQATNEAIQIEVERNNKQDNAIATINQTLISQQNAINEHGNELENLRQETNEAIQSEVERNNAQDQSINVLDERMSRAEQNIGVLNNQVNALPEPQDILTKQNYKMPEGYAPTQPHHLADKKYVDDVVEAMSGTNPEHFVTHAQLDEALYKPDFIDLTIDEPVYHITEATLDSPKEIQAIEGKTEIIINQEDLDIASWKINDTLKNEIYTDENGQKRIRENVGQVTFDGSDDEDWMYISSSPNHGGYYAMDIKIPNAIRTSFINSYDAPNTYSWIEFRDAEEIIIHPTTLGSLNIKLPATNQAEFKQYLSHNPLTVTYELAVKNPKTKVIDSSDLYNTIDYVRMAKPVDFSGNVAGLLVNDLVKNIDRFNVTTSWIYVYPKDITVAELGSQLVGKTLTYELAQPRLCKTDGIAPVKNPVIESVGKNLFDINKIEPYGNYDATILTIEGNTIKLRRTDMGAHQGFNIYIPTKVGETYTLSFHQNVTADRNQVFSLAPDFMGTQYIHGERFVKHTFVAQNPVTEFRGRFGTYSNEYSYISNIMLNEGTTPLPYEPYRSTKLAINGEYHQWDKIVNDGGVYWDEVGSGKVVFDGDETITQNSLQPDGIFTVYFEDKPENIYHDYTFTEIPNIFSSEYITKPFIDRNNGEGITLNPSNGRIFFSIEGTKLHDDLESLDISERVDLLKQYLSQNPLTVVYQLATPTRKPTSIIKAGDPDFSQGNTIYLHSDTGAIPTVHAKVAMDIAGQVNQLTKDSSDKSKKLHDHEIAIVDLTNRISDVENSEIPLATVDNDGLMSKDDKQAINDLNTEVSDINQTIAILEDDVSQNSSMIASLQNELATLQNELATLQSLLPKGVDDATLTIDGQSGGSSFSVQIGVDRTFTLAVAGLAFYTVSWSVSGKLSIMSTDGNKVKIIAEDVGLANSLTATITDVAGRKKSITVNIAVLG